MRTACLIVLYFVAAAVGQKPKEPPPLPKKAAEELKAITAKLTETAGEVKELRGGDFVQFKSVASGVSSRAIESPHAEKPVAARVRWDSITQYSKNYSSKENAEKAKEWLKPGRVPNVDNGFTKGTTFEALYFYVDGKWQLDEITWGGASSTAKGNSTKWTGVLGEPARKPKKKD